MQTSTIKFSQIEDRIDAEYYKPEFLEIYDNLKNKEGVFLLKDVIKEVVSGSYIDTYFPKGNLYLRVNNLKEGGFDLSNVECVDIQYSKIPQRIRVHTNDLVLGRTGTIGVVLIVPNELDGAVMSQHITKIIPKDMINRFYLMVYLNSKYGRLQGKKTALGSMQKELTLDATKDIRVFIPSRPFQQKIEEMVKEAQEKRKLADEKYKEAEEILNKELGLEALDLSTQKTFEAKFSKTEERIDSEYYQPKYYKFWNIVRKRADLKKLQDIIVKIDYGTVPTSPYVSKEQGIPYLKGKDVKPNHIILDDLDYLHKGTKHLVGDKIVKENDILITQMGTVGDAAVIPKEAKDFAFGSFILRIRLKDFSKTDPYYIATIINSPIGKLQIFREMRIATVRANTDIPTVKNLKIPILSQKIQQKISSLIQESFGLRKESKELIDGAKKEVETMVENK